MLINASVCLSTVTDHDASVTDWPLSSTRNESPGARLSRLLRRVDALIRKLKRAVVDRDAGPGPQDLMGLNRLLGSHVHRRHEPARLVCSDRQQRQSRRSESLADTRKMVAESRVSGEIDHAACRLDHVSAPQGSIAVEHSPRREMHRRHAVNRRAPAWAATRPNPVRERDLCRGTAAAGQPRPEQ